MPEHAGPSRGVLEVQVRITRLEDKWHVELSGALSAHDALAMRATLASLGPVILDFRGLRAFSDVAMAILASWLRAPNAPSAELRGLCPRGEDVMRAFGISCVPPGMECAGV